MQKRGKSHRSLPDPTMLILMIFSSLPILLLIQSGGEECWGGLLGEQNQLDHPLLSLEVMLFLTYVQLFWECAVSLS